MKKSFIDADQVGGLTAGDVVAGRYQVHSLVGSGGMGQVYIAKDLKLKGKRWAMKEVPHLRTADLFLREAKIMAQLNHPCLPNIIDYIAPNKAGFAYLIMDYIEGMTLDKWFNRRDFSLVEILDMTLQLCGCFRYLHELLPHPIVYRDLKPSNVMVDELGQVKLIDFGTARMFEANKQTDTYPLGTFHFAAPEQLEGTQTDPRTDLYGIGALMYYLLTGRYFNVERKSLAHWCPNAPRKMIYIVDQLLAPDRNKRIQSAAVLEHMLHELRLTIHPEMTEKLHPPLHKHTKLIVVGGLYRGAGATFASIQIARLLHVEKISHNMTEYVGTHPQLYDWLNGDQNCPKNYVYYPERTPFNQQYIEWKTGRTVWYPLRPVLTKVETYTRFDVCYWLRHITEPVTIVDISTQWADHNVQQLCKQADLICFVADPQRARFNGLSARLHVQHALRWREKGKNVQFLANRSLDSLKMKPWFDAFPWFPAASIPNVDYAQIVEAEQKEKMIQDRPDLLQACRHSLATLIELLK